MGQRKQRIIKVLSESLRGLQTLEVVDESHQHNGPEGAESHFKVLAVCEHFQGMGRVDRQRQVYEWLDQELKSGLHALSLRLLTPAEWQQQSTPFQSPDCLGGEKNKS